MAYLRGQISGESFSVFASLALLAFAYLGGIGSVSGALVAGVIAVSYTHLTLPTIE